MPDHKDVPSPGGGVIAEFAADLWKLRKELGTPSTRTLADRAGWSKSTVSDAFGGKRLPSRQAVVDIVTALAKMRVANDAEVDLIANDWAERYDEAAQIIAAESGDPTAAEISHLRGRVESLEQELAKAKAIIMNPTGMAFRANQIFDESEHRIMIANRTEYRLRAEGSAYLAEITAQADRVRKQTIEFVDEQIDRLTRESEKLAKSNEDASLLQAEAKLEADRILEEARIAAERLTESARSQAENALEEAARRAQVITERASAQAEFVLSEAVHKAHELMVETDLQKAERNVGEETVPRTAAEP